MRKRNVTPQLSRSSAHRDALLRNLSQELIRHGKVKTTLAKAKALRPFVEPLITKAKLAKPNAKDLISRVLYDHEIVKKLLDEVGPGYAKDNRNGGYTRIIKLGNRQGDNSEEAIIQLVEVTEEKETVQKKTSNKKKEEAK